MGSCVPVQNTTSIGSTKPGQPMISKKVYASVLGRMNTEPDLEGHPVRQPTRNEAKNETSCEKALGDAETRPRQETKSPQKKKQPEQKDGLEMVRLHRLKVEEMCCIIKTEGSEIKAYVPLLEQSPLNSTLLRRRVVLGDTHDKQFRRMNRMT